MLELVALAKRRVTKVQLAVVPKSGTPRNSLMVQYLGAQSVKAGLRRAQRIQCLCRSTGKLCWPLLGTQETGTFRDKGSKEDLCQQPSKSELRRIRL